MSGSGDPRHPRWTSTLSTSFGPSQPHLNLRFPGDGLDFRRPVMTRPSQEVIDLTDDIASPVRLAPIPMMPAPPPRLVRDVISIDENEDSARHHPSVHSPELEFMFSRTLLPTAMPISRHARQFGNQEQGRASGQNSRQTNDGQLPMPTSWADFRNRGHRSILQGFQAVSTTHSNRHQHSRHGTATHTSPQNRARIRPVNILGTLTTEDPMFINAGPQVNLPNHLDFRTQGFTWTYATDGTRSGAQAAPHSATSAPRAPPGPPPPPSYDPPPPPHVGYTRAPKEEDTLICPNCEQELGVGENDLKREVWVIKKCGHVSAFTTSSEIDHVAKTQLRFTAENAPSIGRKQREARTAVICPNHLRNA